MAKSNADLSSDQIGPHDRMPGAGRAYYNEAVFLQRTFESHWIFEGTRIASLIP